MKRLSVSAIDHIVINTSNPQKMAECYLAVLGMKH
ncbi:VOC family protein [Zymomonas mobilis]